MDKFKVAIVDDEKLFIQGLKLIIEQESNLSVVFTAINGEILLEKLNSPTCVPDVILLDLSMPRLDGVDTLLEINKKYPGNKVIILSSHYNDSIIIKLLEEGASGFLAKNDDPVELVNTIKQVIEKGFHINEHILQLVRNRRLISKRNVSQIPLSGRELEVIELICNEYTTKEIAEYLKISPRTVDGHRNRILEKTGCKNLAGIVVYAIKHNLYKVHISKYS